MRLTAAERHFGLTWVFKTDLKQLVKYMNAKKESPLLATTALILGVLGASSSYGNIILTGDFMGMPPDVPLTPCPAHGSAYCTSTLEPLAVDLITQPTDWFADLIQSKYLTTSGWNFHYLGSDTGVSGSFNVEYYAAYNDCPGLMGAEIEVNFVPDADSSVQDVMWIQAIHGGYPEDRDRIDDRDNLPIEKRPGTLFGPFYPYQDEDEELPRWQSSKQYDKFYDKPGRECPNPGTSLTWVGECYAAWWDDYFEFDTAENKMKIVDVGDDGHNIYIYEGFRWGFELACSYVPETSTPYETGIMFSTVVLLIWGFDRSSRRSVPIKKV